jgi:hypothetical protein
MLDKTKMLSKVCATISADFALEPVNVPRIRLSGHAERGLHERPTPHIRRHSERSTYNRRKIRKYFPKIDVRTKLSKQIYLFHSFEFT